MNESGDHAPPNGPVILITGAGGGLGRVAAEACATHGAQLVLLDRAVRKLEQLSDRLAAAGHRQPALCPLDLAQAGDAEYAELAEIIEGHFGALHGLLHCAADPGNLGPLIDQDLPTFERLLRVNLSAAHGLTRALLPLLRQTGDARIVFTTDTSARRGQAYWGPYGIAKIALEALARMLAEELESEGRVRVHVLAPGPIDSPIRRHTHAGERPDRRRPTHAWAARIVRLLGIVENAHGEFLVETP
jgi:NAD(P)-dependent dehydrogenase (short-subunit alcohol dehydrogenase family)